MGWGGVGLGLATDMGPIINELFERVFALSNS